MKAREGQTKASATHVPQTPGEAVAKKLFREDLQYRLAMVEVRPPRLADRKEDLPLLQRHFTAHFAALFGRKSRA
jgi:DNA-binding NtrC family response regulator